MKDVIKDQNGSLSATAVMLIWGFCMWCGAMGAAASQQDAGPGTPEPEVVEQQK